MFLLEHCSWYINVYLHGRNTKCFERPTFSIAYDNYRDSFLHWDTDVYYFEMAFLLNKSHWINSSFQKKKKKPSTSKLCFLTLKGKKICPVAIFPNLYFWMMFSWTCLSSHLHACESGLYQKSVILQHSKFSVRRVSRPVCLFIDIHM